MHDDAGRLPNDKYESVVSLPVVSPCAHISFLYFTVYSVTLVLLYVVCVCC